jgi:hypothetical protein
MMTATALNPYRFRDSRFLQFFQSSYAGSRTLTLHAAAMMVGFAICVVLQNIDSRTFNGINLWIKPGKFFFSLAVHIVTVAWALSLIQLTERNTRVIQWSIWTILVTGWSEQIYITLRAAQGEASHFNVSTPLNGALYGAMAVFAILLVVAPAVIGWAIWRRKPNDFWTQSVALGFGLAMVLSIVVGMTLGGNSGHWIGGDLTDATGLPIFKWSTTGGDLRVAHFLGLHAMQTVPLAALSGRRDVVYGVALSVSILTVLTFMQALMGVPLLRG